MSDADELARLERLLTADEPAELRNYIALPDTGYRVAGSTTVPLGLTVGTTTPSGLMVPDHTGPSLIDYAGVYITLDQYFLLDRGQAVLAREAVVTAIRNMATTDTMLLYLALLNTIKDDPPQAQVFLQEFRAMVRPDVRERLDNALQGDGGPDRHHLLARQPLLSAMRLVIERGGGNEDTEAPAMRAALLSHAVGMDLAAELDSSAELCGVPEPLFLEMLRLGLLYEHDDLWSSIDRVVRLWTVFGRRVSRFPFRADPDEMLTDATGLRIVEMIGLGFLLYAHASQWRPNKPAYFATEMGVKVSSEKVAAFRRHVAATLDDFRDTFAGRTASAFDFLPFQERPVLLTEKGLLVLDLRYLWERVTTGLYWVVHDHERANNDRDRQRWTQSFAEAVELMVEDQLRHLAPPVLGGGTSFYSEEDLERAYGEDKRCDAAVDFGSAVLLTEVVSGWLTVPTRIDGDPKQFRADTDRLVISKCEQLDRSARGVLSDSAALTGTQVAGLRVVPVLVVGGGYPNNPFTARYINERLAEKKFLDDARIEKLCILDLAELEMLEGLAERGQDAVGVLVGWKRSGLADGPLRNYVIHEWGGGIDVRPSRMKASVNETFERIISLLGLPPEAASPETESDPR